ncbi:MAG: heat-inducible transcriptional repressor HrcA [Chloroflexota bacterium]|nr:heat-inducible transcriptional repressor HrcA [Chloroflexota bacterium]
MLSERKERILKAVVQEYTRSARPVASETLQREHGMAVSSATIRNEMAELEAEGYIYQPHTSAGRIPSEQGYRYFVQRLMQEERLPRSEQLTIRHQFHQVALMREQWLQLGVAVLARVVRAAAIVSTPQMASCRIKHFEMLQMQERLGLLVLVLQEGSVKQQQVSLPDGTSQEDLSSASQRLNVLLHGQSRLELAGTAQGERTTPTERFLVDSLRELMAEIDARDTVTVYHDGLVELLDQPEFASVERARAIVEVLERPQVLRELLPGVGADDGIQILIGSENRWDWMKECAVVLARYGDVNDVTGVIGVLGPLRLPYGVAVPSVRYVARIMTELLDDFGGSASLRGATPGGAAEANAALMGGAGRPSSTVKDVSNRKRREGASDHGG